MLYFINRIKQLYFKLTKKIWKPNLLPITSTFIERSQKTSLAQPANYLSIVTD